MLSTEGAHPGGSVHTGGGEVAQKAPGCGSGPAAERACWFPSLAAEATAGWPLFCSWIPVSPSQDSALVLESWVEKMLGASPQPSLPVLGVSHSSFPSPSPTHCSYSSRPPRPRLSSCCMVISRCRKILRKSCSQSCSSWEPRSLIMLLE